MMDYPMIHSYIAMLSFSFFSQGVEFFRLISVHLFFKGNGDEFCTHDYDVV